MTRRIFCRLLLVIVAFFAILAFASSSWAQGRSDEALEHAKQVQERHTDELMALPGVVGTAVGLGQGAQPVVLVLLEHGGVPSIPAQLEGVPVRPMVTGKIYARPKPPWAGGGSGIDPTSRFPRPVPIGVSTGHPDITAGTIGCRVVDGSGNLYALSNNHVYANQNRASTGDAVIQPGTYDGGSSPADDIGNLFDFEPIKFDGSDNTIDAAIASTTTALVSNATPSDGYGTPNSSTVAPSPNLAVQKYGRTTGLTHGSIAAINATVNVDYGSSNVAHFVGQIVISPGSFSSGGDSGSLIVTDDDNRNPVGLLFAGSTLYTIANPIDAVLSRFGVTVDGEAATSPAPPLTEGTVSVFSITYATEGGKNGDRHLLITVALMDGDGFSVSGASVSIGLYLNGSLDSQGTGTTGTNGEITFSRKNAPSGTYTTTVTNVDAGGLTWDGETPLNSFLK